MAKAIEVLYKILGRLPKSEFSSVDRPLDAIMDLIKTISPSVFTDHVIWSGSIPSDSVMEIDVGGAMILQLRAKNSPIKVNFDRGVANEYIVIDPDTYRVIPRLTTKIYAQTLQGYPPGFLEVFGLKVV